MTVNTVRAVINRERGTGVHRVYATYQAQSLHTRVSSGSECLQVESIHTQMASPVKVMPHR